MKGFTRSRIGSASIVEPILTTMRSETRAWGSFRSSSAAIRAPSSDGDSFSWSLAYWSRSAVGVPFAAMRPPSMTTT